MNGWIALSRKLLTWQWHDEPKMVALWVHILLRACHEEIKYHGITLQRGQFATSIRALGAYVGLSSKEVRLGLRRLLEEESIRMASAKGSCTVISVINYDAYQIEAKETPKGNKRANFLSSKSDGYSDLSKTEGKEKAMEGQSKGNEKAMEGQCEKGVDNEGKIPQKGNERANFLSSKSDGYSDFAKTKGQWKGNEKTIETDSSEPLQNEAKGHNNNNNNNIYPSSSSYAGVCAREAGCGTPPTGSGDGEADLGKRLQELLCDPAYSPIILMRSKMTAEEALAYIPEFIAQCRLRGKTWPSVRELTEHFANWLTLKPTYLNEQKSNNNGTPPRGGDADERERHNAVVQTALGLMAGSTRDD